jgi:parallel beta-helix repeat protein
MSAAEHARISVFKDDNTGKKQTAYDVTIQGNTIINEGGPDSPTANSASSAGILVSRGSGFLVAGNTVVRSLADGIHITDGSSNGRVLGNTVRETGDDMIGLVSYAQSGKAALNTARGLLDILNNGTGLNKNLLVEGNNLSNNYWGRGIGVIGGEAFTIKNNSVSGVPGAGGILVAREHNYLSHGVNNVRVEYNTIRNIQNTTPPYNPKNKFEGVRTGHGAIEMHDFLFMDEYADAQIREKLSTKNVLIQKNTIIDSDTAGVRTGVSDSGTVSATNPNTGSVVSRSYRTGIVKMTGLSDLTFRSVGNVQLKTPGTEVGSMSCARLTLNGLPYTVANCAAPAPVVTGAVLSGCSAAAQ